MRIELKSGEIFKSEKEITKKADKLDRGHWYELSNFFLQFSTEFIDNFADDFNWTVICFIKGLPENLIRKYHKKINWDTISYSQNLSEDLIRDFNHLLCWNSICEFQNLSNDFIKEFESKIVWSHLSMNQNLSKSIIKNYFDKMHYKNLIFYKTKPYLSDEILENILKKQDSDSNFMAILSYQKPSDAFLEKHIERIVNWSSLCDSQDLSVEFIKKHSDKISFFTLVKSKHFTLEKLYSLKEFVEPILRDVVTIRNTEMREFFLKHLEEHLEEKESWWKRRVRNPLRRMFFNK